jgi:hypothetical protein
MHYCFDVMAREIEVKNGVVAVLNFSLHILTSLAYVTIVRAVIYGIALEQELLSWNYGEHRALED